MQATGTAIVGTGFIGPVHVEALRRLGRRVVGILGSTPEKSAQSARALGLEKGYGSFEDVLADPAVTVVHLASPNRYHFEQCRSALAAGKHVVCEKPLAMTTAETAELVKLAAGHPHLVTAVNYNVRFYPLVLEARDRIHAGDLGEVFHVTGSYLQDWLMYVSDFNWRVLPAAGGELRAVADIGTHWLDTICFVTGLEITAVCADLRTVHDTRYRPSGGSETFSGTAGHRHQPAEAVPIHTEDYGSILLRFKGGAKGVVTVSQVAAGRKNSLRFDLAGGKASISWDSEEPNTLHIGHRLRSNEALSRDPALLGPTAQKFADYPGGHAEGFPDSFKQLYKAIYHDIDHGKSPAPLYATFADGHREVQLCEAILRSHREQRWVAVE